MINIDNILKQIEIKHLPSGKELGQLERYRTHLKHPPSGKELGQLETYRTHLKIYIKLINDKGKHISDPKKIVELSNKYFVNIGPIDSKIPKAYKHFSEFMRKLKGNKTFFLTATTQHEIYDIISAFDIKKSLGPNSIPVYILKISNNFFSNKLTDIILSFRTGYSNLQ